MSCACGSRLSPLLSKADTSSAPRATDGRRRTPDERWNQTRIRRPVSRQSWPTIAGVCRAIARVLAAESDRDDLYQDIALALWRSFDSFAGRSSVATWVYRVAVDAAVSYAAKPPFARGTRRPMWHPPTASRHAKLAAASRWPIFRSSWPAIGTVDRALFTLYLDDLSYREMADILGISETASACGSII